jgi:hypothetical protein
MDDREKHLSTADLAATKQDKPSEAIETQVPERPESGVPSSEASSERAPNQTGDYLVPLFSEASVRDFRAQWTSLQTGFVDEPRRAVEHADELVARVMKDLAATFSDERSKLERQWNQGDKVSTEDLRVALRRYRSFFDRFLSI